MFDIKWVDVDKGVRHSNSLLLPFRLSQDWTSTTTISHVLSVIRCLLIVPFPESSLNDEAGKLFMESYDEFARRARIMTDVHALSDESSKESAEGVGVAVKVVDKKVSAKVKKEKEVKKKSLKRL